MTTATRTTLDLAGLKCPLPALKTRKALSRLAEGDELFVICTDPLASIDIPNLVRETGDVLVSQGSVREVHDILADPDDGPPPAPQLTFTIRKAAR